MSKETLLALAARCEAADGPDRELDAEIAALFGDVSWKRANYTMEQFPAIHWREPHPYAGMSEPVYEYTASIDAALTLLHLATLWANGSMEDGPFARLCWPQSGGTFAGGYIEAAAATPALALCAAALKARAQSEQNHD